MSEQPMGNSPYATPNADVDVEISVEDMPGIKRLPYFLAGIGVAIAQFAIVALAAEAPMASLIVALLALVASIYLGFLRFKNIGHSGWLALLFIVPIANLFVGIMALAFPPGYAITKQMDTAGKIIIGLFVGVVIIGIIAGVMGA